MIETASLATDTGVAPFLQAGNPDGGTVFTPPRAALEAPAEQWATAQQIADHMGVSYTTVAIRVLRLGIERSQIRALKASGAKYTYRVNRESWNRLISNGKGTTDQPVPLLSATTKPKGKVKIATAASVSPHAVKEIGVAPDEIGVAGVDETALAPEVKVASVQEIVLDGPRPSRQDVIDYLVRGRNLISRGFDLAMHMTDDQEFTNFFAACRADAAMVLRSQDETLKAAVAKLAPVQSTQAI